MWWKIFIKTNLIIKLILAGLIIILIIVSFFIHLQNIKNVFYILAFLSLIAIVMFSSPHVNSKVSDKYRELGYGRSLNMFYDLLIEMKLINNNPDYSKEKLQLLSKECDQKIDDLKSITAIKSNKSDYLFLLLSSVVTISTSLYIAQDKLKEINKFLTWTGCYFLGITVIYFLLIPIYHKIKRYDYEKYLGQYSKFRGWINYLLLNYEQLPELKDFWWF